ncbi:MAG: protein kinase [Burkholderiales bacterium]|nr:protein kinase [Burkholderiales bacterium]
MAAAAELKQLGRYDLTAVLGKGAMGIVYEGMDPKLHRKVAIKTILKGHMDDDDAAKEYSMRFMREAQAVARLNHPHIVQVYDFGEEGDVAYIVMEFIKGKELKNFFDANERFELKEAVRIMCELLDALDFAHEGGIVHRDIKPANVMLDSQARVKLADFGVARVADDRSAAEKTQAGTMVGTPAYMSPEQITGGSVDRRSDIFSAGIILYQFLTGEKPFTGSGAWTIAKKIIQDHPPVPSSINNTISPLFDNVVNKALAKTVEQRYQTAKEFGAALKRALEGRSDEDESDRTVVGSMGDMTSLARPAATVAGAKADSTGRTGSTGSQEVELEFWRAIKDGNDPDDFELYVQQFPTGIYAALAKRKIAKLKGVAPEETGAEAKAKEKKEAEEAAKREAEVRQKLADEKARLEAQLAAKEAEYAKREKEAEARRQAEEKARAEAEAKRIAQERARAEAETKARKEELEKARREAEAVAAQREAEYAKREAEMRARREAEDKARKEAEARAEQARQVAEAKAEQARKEAERARLEAEAKAEAARREATEKARKETEALAKGKAEAEARAKKEAEERARKEAEAAKREAELKKKLAEAPKAKMPIHIVAGVIIAIAAAGGGAWYYFNKASLEKQAALTAALENAAKETEALKQAQAQQQAALKKLEEARTAELAAIKSGDQAKIKEAQEAAKRAEAEASKQAEAVKAREAAAADARKKAQEAAEKAKSAKAPEQKAPEQVAKAPEPAPVKAPAPVVKAPEPAPVKAPEPVAKVAEPPRAKTRSEREREEEDRLARQMAAKKNVQVASVSPSLTSPATPTDASTSPGSPGAPASTPAVSVPAVPSVDLFEQAQGMEASDPKAAVKIYRSLARKGNGKAAKRLGEIYDKGIAGIPRDYAESLQWYETARKLGETIETAGKR